MNAAALSTITVNVPRKVAEGIAALGAEASTSPAAMAQNLLMAAYASKVKPGDDPELDAAVGRIDADAEARITTLANRVDELLAQAEIDRAAIATRDNAIEGLRAAGVDGRRATAALAANGALASNERLELELAAVKAVVADGQKAIDEAQRDAERWRAEARSQGRDAVAMAEKHEAYRNEAHARLERAAAGERAAREEVEVLKGHIEMLKKAVKGEAAAAPVGGAPHPCTEILVRLIAFNDTAQIAAATDLAESSIANMIARWREAMRLREGASNGDSEG
jgi:hypothetical protein